MIAFLGKSEIKEEFLLRVRKHREAEELLKGFYWKDGKGCAVGCTIHGNGPTAYEAELGLPYSLGRLEDVIFESLPNSEAVLFPEQFLEAIPVGSNPEVALWKFGHFCCDYLRTHELDSVRLHRRLNLLSHIDRIDRLFAKALTDNIWPKVAARKLEGLGDAIIAEAVIKSGDESWENESQPFECEIGREIEGMLTCKWARVSEDKAQIYRDELFELLKSAPCTSGEKKY